MESECLNPIAFSRHCLSICEDCFLYHQSCWCCSSYGFLGLLFGRVWFHSCIEGGENHVQIWHVNQNSDRFVCKLNLSVYISIKKPFSFFFLHNWTILCLFFQLSWSSVICGKDKAYTVWSLFDQFHFEWYFMLHFSAEVNTLSTYCLFFHKA